MCIIIAEKLVSESECVQELLTLTDLALLVLIAITVGAATGSVVRIFLDIRDDLREIKELLREKTVELVNFSPRERHNSWVFTNSSDDVFSDISGISTSSDDEESSEDEKSDTEDLVGCSSSEDDEKPNSDDNVEG